MGVTLGLCSPPKLGFIRRHCDGPFFSTWPTTPPISLQAPEADLAQFAETGRFNQGVCTLYGYALQRGPRRSAAAGRLERHGLAEDTIVLFTSDNGPDFGGRGAAAPRAQLRFNGAKGNVSKGYPGPAMLRWPAACGGRARLRRPSPTL
jgi:hypothetical protein